MQKLLLLHGAISSSAQFSVLLPLLKKNFEVYTFNFSGHGGNPLLEKEFGIELFAEETIEFLDQNQIPVIDIFGYSMGGYVALYLAKYRPMRVGKIFTLATKFNWNPQDAAKEAAMLNPQKIEDKIPAFAKYLAEKHGAENWKNLLLKTAEMMIALGNNPLLAPSVLSEIQNDVMLSVGDSDNMVSQDETLAACRNLSNAQLLTLPQTQHPFEKVNPELLARELEKYFLLS